MREEVDPARGHVGALEKASITGTYDGRLYSGHHGDLTETFAETVYSILR